MSHFCTKISTLIFLFCSIYAVDTSKEYKIRSSLDACTEIGVQIDWSILICTLDERVASFTKLYEKLAGQIRKLGLERCIEILWFCDNRTYSIAFKRNRLLQAAQGTYVNFLDDDDDIHENYIEMIHQKLKSDIDCVKLVGIITFDGLHPRLFTHSVKYDRYFTQNNMYYRPPNHLNTMKREIAQRFQFPENCYESNDGEDTIWALQVAKSGLLRKEADISEPYYFYLYKRKN